MKNFNEFLAAKEISVEDFAKKEAQDMASLYNEYNEKTSKDLADAVEAKASKEEITKLREEMNAATIKQMNAINEALKAQAGFIKGITAEKASTKSFSIAEQLGKNLDILKALKEKGDKNINLSFKAPATMLNSTNVSGGNVPVEQRIAGVDDLPSRTVRLLDVISRGVADSPIISWVSKANRDGAVGQTAEGVLKNQIDFDLVVDSERVKKTTAYIKVSNEMLEDISFIESEIRNELMVELLKAVELQVYNGDNIGENLNGIATQASAFAAGTFAATVDNANEIDVLTVAVGQIEEAEQSSPTYHFVHPRTITSLRLIKTSTTDKRYVDRLQDVAGSLVLDGISIIKTTLIPVGQYLTGHFPNATLYEKGSIQMNMGYENDDFTKNLVTILAEWRGLNLIKTNKRASFVAGVFATDMAALETA